MGQIVNLKCERCGYEANLWVGAGMTFFDIEKTITLFNKDTQQRIRNDLEKNPKGTWTITKEIGVCERCRKISAIPVFILNKEDGTVVEYIGKCICGGDVDIVDTEKVLSGEIKLECPACGDLLVAKNDGYWD